MALSPSTAFLEAMTGSECEVRFYVVIDHNDGSSQWKAVGPGSMDPNSDLYDRADIPAAIKAISPVGVELDPLTRETQMGELFIDFVDGFIRPILVNNRLKGQKCTVKVGARSLNEADFLSYFVGPIEEIFPMDGEVVRFSVLDPFTVLQNTKILGYWANVHPLEALYNGTDGVLDKCDLAAAQIDTTSFDPVDAAYTGDISHFIVSRGVGSLMYGLAVSDPTPAFDVAAGLVRLMNGQLAVDEDGAMSFKRFDASASAVDDWGVNDILPGSFKQPALDENVINRMTAYFARNVQNKRHEHTYVADDTTSQGNYKYPGQTERILTAPDLVSNWHDHHAYLQGNINDAVNSFDIMGGSPHAFCGFKDGSPANTTVSADRPLYLMLDSSFIAGINNIEIISATTVSIASSSEKNYPTTDPDDGTVTVEAFDSYATISNVSRGQVNTSASSHKGASDAAADKAMLTKVYDVTIFVILFNELLARFADGCPIVELETLFTKIKYQIGDLITLTYPKYMAYGKDGITDSDKWEIVGKEADYMASPPRIKWKLAAAGEVAISIGTTFPGNSRVGSKSMQADALTNNDLMQPHIIWGLEVVDAGGLDVTVEKGEAAGHMARAMLQEDWTKPLGANRDIYIYFDLLDGGIIPREVPNNDPAPTSLGHELYLDKVVTDAADITSIGSVTPNTAPVGELTSIENRTLDDIQDGSTWYRVQDVSAANEITDTSIENAAVVEAKIGPLAVTEGKIGALAVTSGKLGADSVIAGKVATGGISASGQLADSIVGVNQRVNQTQGFHNFFLDDWSEG